MMFEEISEDTFMLYFEIDEVEWSSEKSQIINNCPVTIQVQFLNYLIFILEQEEYQNCPEQLPRFKPHQCFNLKLPKHACQNIPELQFNVYKILTETCQQEHIFSTIIQFEECQQRNLQNFFDKTGECSTSFSVNGRYRLTDRDGAFSGSMTVRLRLIRCEETQDSTSRLLTPRAGNEIRNSAPLELRDQQNYLNSKIDCLPENIDDPINEIDDPNVWGALKKTYSSETFCKCSSDSNMTGPSEKEISFKNSGSECERKTSFNPCSTEYNHNLRITTYKDIMDKGNMGFLQFADSNELLLQHYKCPLKLTAKAEHVSKTIENVSNTFTEEFKEKIESDTKFHFQSPKSVLKSHSSKTTQKSAHSKSKSSHGKTKMRMTHKKKYKLEEGTVRKPIELNQSRSQVAAKQMKKFVYDIGDFYPGFGRAHKHCIDDSGRIPAKMGWMWYPREQVGNLKPRHGWRPGAINKLLREMMREAKSGFMQAHVAKQPKSARKHHAGRGLLRIRSQTSVRRMPQHQEQEDDLPEPPTLRLLRKDGTYHIILYPVDQETKVPRVEVPRKPMEFTIERDKDDTSSTASDMEIEYSVPAMVSRYRKKPNVVHVETQVKQDEILKALKEIR